MWRLLVTNSKAVVCRAHLPLLWGPRRVAPFGETLQQHIYSAVITSSVPVNKKAFPNNLI